VKLRLSIINNTNSSVEARLGQEINMFMPNWSLMSYENFKVEANQENKLNSILELELKTAFSRSVKRVKEF
jgi:hypothetical protein